jgi:hypothetical protein
MILTTTIEIYSRNKRQDANNEGIPQFTYDLFLISRASVQPLSLSEAKLDQWGLTTIGADAKHIFIPGVVKLGQSWLIKDLGTSERYELRGTNPWIRHTEIIAEPYQGGEPV